MTRFDDENYRNWLKITESLNALREGLRRFLENETDSHHSSILRKLQQILKEATCQNKCDGKHWQKKIPDCKVCTPWKNEIVACHTAKGSTIYWKNCKPHLWPKNKWEVAKVYMPQGHQEHTIYDHFDIAALLNLMGHCNHFRSFIKDQPINKVINVRNCVMHSPDFRVSHQNFQQHLEKIKTFAGLMDRHAEDLKMLPDKVKKICETVDDGLVNQLHKAASKQGDLPDPQQQKCMEMEQKALKEKIEFLTQRYEEDQDGVKEEIEGIRTFLRENEDLKEKLAPQMEQLQKRVDEHERQINLLNERVDQLEVKVIQEPKKDPLFGTNPLKYKNHIFELARKYDWPEPVFTENLEGDGYRGHLEVKGLSFTGEQVCLSKKLAHQEVAKKALESLQAFTTSAGEGGQTKHPLELSESSTSEGMSGGQELAKTVSQYFYGSVKVVLDTEVASEEGYSSAKEASEAAYGKLAVDFGLDKAKTGFSKQDLVFGHCKEHNFPQPVENCSQSPNEKYYCKLRFCEPLTFHDKDGSTKKKLAEQQAAKCALQQLSRVLNWKPNGENYKGDLKERLEALGLGPPFYDVTKKEEVSCDEHSSTDSRPPQAIVNEPTVVNMEVCNRQTDGCEDSERALSKLSGDDNQTKPNKEESTCASVKVQGARHFGRVTIALDTMLEDKEGHPQERDAVESAYRKLAESFGLDDSEPGFSKAVVQKYFERSGHPLPEENIQPCLDDKFSCSLKLCGSFTFVDQEGSTRRKLAEQQAAKCALQQLSGVLNWEPKGENYKGDLKERLEALGLGPPFYDVTKKEEVSAVALVDSEPAGSSKNNPTPGGSSASNSKDHPSTKPDTNDAAPVIPTIELSSPPVHSKQAKVQFQEVEKLLEVLGLLLPVVTCEKCSMKQKFKCSAGIKLDGYTLVSSGYYKTKKEASRKAYHLFALATGICPPGAGSSEGEARQAAFQDAFSKLGLLSGVSGSVGAVNNAEERLSSLLKMGGQGEPVCSIKAQQYKAYVQLKFTDFKMEHKGTTNKKQARNYLSERILKILGVDTDVSTSGSLRNSLDDWFKQRKLHQPNFEELKDEPGIQVTFSAPFSCSSPDWKDSWEEAEKSLLQELTARLSSN